MKRTFANLFQEYSFFTISLDPSWILNGPSSVKNPSNEEHPGPPFVQINKGSVSASREDSASTQKRDLSLGISM